jgi:hypothetical protein
LWPSGAEPREAPEAKTVDPGEFGGEVPDRRGGPNRAFWSAAVVHRVAVRNRPSVSSL